MSSNMKEYTLSILQKLLYVWWDIVILKKRKVVASNNKYKA